MGLVVAGVGAWITQATINAQALRDKTEAHLAMSDVRNELVYLIASRPMSSAGLEVGDDLELPDPSQIDTIMAALYSSNRSIAFDGRPMTSETHPRISIRIYDGRGLLNLNDLAPGRIDAFLRLFNIKESVRNRLTDTLRDYIDEDDLSRLAGAEARDYLRVGKLPPPNQLMLTPYQAKDIFGWADLTDIWRADLQSPLLGTCQSTGFNPNTATELVLLANLPRLSLDSAREIVRQRQTRALRNQREVSMAAGTTLFEEPFFYAFSPGPCSIVELEDAVTGNRMRYSLTFNPFSRTQPWRHDYELRLPQRDGGTPADSRPPEIFPSPESVATRQGEGPIPTAPR